MVTNDKQSAGDAALSALYKHGDAIEPPADLDDQILAAARKEVRAGPARAKRRTLSPWLIPMSTAAVVVMSVTVVTLMQLQHPEQFDPETLARSNAAKEQHDSAGSLERKRTEGIRINPIPSREDVDARKTMSDDSAGTSPAETLNAPTQEDRARMELLRRQKDAQMRAESEIKRRTFEAEKRKLESDSAAAPTPSLEQESIAPSATNPTSPVINGSRNLTPERPHSIGATQQNIAPPLPEAMHLDADAWLKEIARLKFLNENELANDQLKLFKTRHPDISDSTIDEAIERELKLLNIKNGPEKSE